MGFTIGMDSICNLGVLCEQKVNKFRNHAQSFVKKLQKFWIIKKK